MRLWSIHPKYLDAKGLVALWRESLLAKAVLEGKTKGYINHPQLTRFKEHLNSIWAINKYLEFVYLEANKRGYNFSSDKFEVVDLSEQIFVTNKQIEYEFKHLLRKLKNRDLSLYNKTIFVNEIVPMPIFSVVSGEIVSWERV